MFVMMSNNIMKHIKCASHSCFDPNKIKIKANTNEQIDTKNSMLQTSAILRKTCCICQSSHDPKTIRLLLYSALIIVCQLLAPSSIHHFAYQNTPIRPRKKNKYLHFAMSRGLLMTLAHMRTSVSSIVDHNYGTDHLGMVKIHCCGTKCHQ